jgi:predicted GNAT family acetyltransferase
MIKGFLLCSNSQINLQINPDSAAMKVEHESNETKGVFFIEKEGDRIAHMTYSKWGNNKFIIDHTEVSDQLRGKGAGKQLVMAAVSYARENEMKILPLCPFAQSVFGKVKEIQDVLS